jgi:hypothetical protein
LPHTPPLLCPCSLWDCSVDLETQFSFSYLCILLFCLLLRSYNTTIFLFPSSGCPFSSNIPSCALFLSYECGGLQYTSRRTGRSHSTVSTHLQTNVRTASNASHFHVLDERRKEEEC